MDASPRRDLAGRDFPGRDPARRRSAILPLAAALLLPALVNPLDARAQQQGYGQTMGTTPMERQVYDGGARGGSSGSPLESGNPLDIMNVIRRNQSLSEATPPSSAIDDALRDFDAQAAPAPRAPGASGPRLPGP
jgi:hypothetical protein